jgi:hypothetical protein
MAKSAFPDFAAMFYQIASLTLELYKKQRFNSYNMLFMLNNLKVKYHEPQFIPA